MNFKKISLSLFAGLLAVTGLQAQDTTLLFNGGTQVAITGGGILYVDGAVDNASGLFSNAGYTTVNRSFTNGGTATGGGAATGVYYVAGDWINNNVFNADQSEVSLIGSAQSITGTQATTFYNLTLNTPGSVKTQTIDASVLNIDSINDCESATTDYKLYILNTDTGAIVRGTGFVSSTGPGRLFRSTKSTNTYFFPTGYNNGGVVEFRPVEFTPSVADSEAYSVRFAYNDPTFDGYPRTTRAANVTTIDSVFYHLLKQYNATTPAVLSIYYNPATDGNWNSIGRWQAVPEWQNLDSANDISAVAANAPYYRMTMTGWTDNGNEPHALINGQEVTVPFAFPNVFAPNGADQTNNNTFHIINEGDEVVVQEMRIYDRWGVPVYDGNRDGGMRVTPTSGTQPTYCWDGKYDGKLQPMGNYVYVASVKIESTGKVKTVSGNLALLW